MGYPGDTNQPAGNGDPARAPQPREGGDPLEADDWSRHALSAPLSPSGPPAGEESWHGSAPAWAQQEQPEAGRPAPQNPWNEAQQGWSEAETQASWDAARAQPQQPSWEQRPQQGAWLSAPGTPPPGGAWPESASGPQAAYDPQQGRPGEQTDAGQNTGAQQALGQNPLLQNTGGQDALGTGALGTGGPGTGGHPAYDPQSVTERHPSYDPQQSWQESGAQAPYDPSYDSGQPAYESAQPSYETGHPAYDAPFGQPGQDGQPAQASWQQTESAAPAWTDQPTADSPFDTRAHEAPAEPQQSPWHDGLAQQDTSYGTGAQAAYSGLSAAPPSGAQQQWEGQQFAPQEQSPYGGEQAPYGGEQAPYGAEQAPYAGGPYNPGDQGPYGQSEQWDGDGRPGRGRAAKGGGNNKLLLVGGALAGVLVVGVGAYVVLSGDEEPAKTPVAQSQQPGDASNEPPASKPAPTKAAPAGGYLKSRKTDPKALTLAEAFGRKKFSADGVNYVMSVRKQTTCAQGVHGTALLAALKAGKCTQFLRATFATSGGKLIGTLGVANLATATAAKNAEKAATAKDAYVVAVPAKGVTAKIGTGDALGTAQAHGHFLIMSWVQLPTGKKIPASSHDAVSAFVKGTVYGSNLGPALAFRDQNGKPAR